MQCLVVERIFQIIPIAGRLQSAVLAESIVGRNSIQKPQINLPFILLCQSIMKFFKNSNMIYSTNPL